jgi:NAD(P)-dependent dehydrogenase (short-subunit alcohol dehydrogenase family)
VVNLESVHRLAAAAIAAPLGEDSKWVGGDGHLLIIDDGSVLVESLIEVLKASGARPLVAQAVERAMGAPTFGVDWQDTASVEALVARVRQVTPQLKGIFHLSTNALPFDTDWVGKALKGLRSAIAVARGVSLTNTDPLEFLYIVTAQGGRFGLGKSGTVDALAVGLEGLAHPLRMEMPKTSFRSIDLDPQDSPLVQAKSLVAELTATEIPYRTAYGWKGGERATLSVLSVPLPEQTVGLEPGSVAVFAGGARGIGAVCAKGLAERIQCKVVFLGRTPLSEEAKDLASLDAAERQKRGDQFMKEYKASHPGCTPKAPREAWRKKLQAVETVETLQAIQALGSEAYYYAVDVRDSSAVTERFNEVKARFGQLDVAVHVAGLGGVDTDRMLVRKEWGIIDQVLETKVIGAVNILGAAEAVDAKLFIGFGSIASRFGNSGQVDYASANALLTGLVRAHNLKGSKTVARVLGWGAWDGVGMAVSGPTKDALMAYGVRFISPEQGAECFCNELVTVISPSSPAEVYLSPSWTGLTEMLENQAPALDLGESVQKKSLLGEVVEVRVGEYLRAEHWLDPKAIPFIDHHRYEGTGWVPAVMGMEVSTAAAAALFPNLQPFALRDVVLKKAVRLVRDESVKLITEVHFEKVVGDETLVHSTVSAQFKNRTWVFAEAQVVLGSSEAQFADGIDDSAQHHGPLPIDQELGEIVRQTHKDLYPCNWLRFQTSGPTFQVIDTMTMNVKAGRVEGTMVSTADMEGIYFPMTMMDGVFQAYGVLLCEILQAWAGPPLWIGEMRWIPGCASVQKTTYAIRANLEDKVNYPILHMFDPNGRCIIRMQRGEQGGTSMKELAEQARTKTAVAPGSAPIVIPTPYLGEIAEEIPGRFLRAEKLMDPATEILLKDHKIYIFIIVPAVYYMEAAIEAAARLRPSQPPCALLDFQIHQAMHLIKDPQMLHTEAEVVEEGTKIRLYSLKGDAKKLHAEGIVAHGPLQPLGQMKTWELQNAESRPRDGLYPHRFPNGPIFQVIEKMELGDNNFSISQLRLTNDVAPDRWLPITLLDGAFQVDSATRSGFDSTSGLPKTFRSLRWSPGVANVERVVCLSKTLDSTTEGFGELFFIDNQNNILLHLAEITLTSALPATIGLRSKV